MSLDRGGRRRIQLPREGGREGAAGRGISLLPFLQFMASMSDLPAAGVFPMMNANVPRKHSRGGGGGGQMEIKKFLETI